MEPLATLIADPLWFHLTKEEQNDVRLRYAKQLREEREDAKKQKTREERITWSRKN